MGEVVIGLENEQVDIVRRAVARDSENTAEAIVSTVRGLGDGHFREKDARHDRERLDYLMGMLAAEVGILRQLPWSCEEGVELGLEDNPEELRLAFAQKDREEELKRGAAGYPEKDPRWAEFEYRYNDEHAVHKLRPEIPYQPRGVLERFVGREEEGLVTLEDLAIYRRDQIAELEGVGEKTMATLDRGMAEAGLAFAEPVRVQNA